jgi:hypothetical protein
MIWNDHAGKRSTSDTAFGIYEIERMQAPLSASLLDKVL